MCLLPDVINSVGLFLDIGGVILLFFYGLPEEVSQTGAGSFFLFLDFYFNSLATGYESSLC